MSNFRNYRSIEKCISRLEKNLRICKFNMDNSKKITYDLFTNVMDDALYVFYDGFDMYRSEMSIDHIIDLDLKQKASEMMDLFERFLEY